jgi:tripartite-type tricarboxylate transporter receptor subunit TctC
MGKKNGVLKVNGRRILYSTILFFILVQPCIATEDPAQFPSKPITLIIPWAPGGSTDLSGRKLADLTGKILGQPMVIENKPGASGVIGINAVAKAAPDGYTIGAMTYSANVIIPHLRSVPYDTKKDFSFIMQYCEAPMIFSVLIDSPWKTFKEFVEEARKNPGKMKYSTPGPLGGQHIFMEHVFFLEEVKVNHIPVGGGTEATRQLLGGHLDGAITPDFVPHIQSGKVRGLAVQPEKRMKAVPDIPTFLELGYKVESPNYTGICAPQGLHPVVLKKLFDAFKKAYEDPSFQEFMAKIYLPTVFRDSGSFKEMVFKDFDSQGRVLKELGLIK